MPKLQVFKNNNYSGLEASQYLKTIDLKSPISAEDVAKLLKLRLSHYDIILQHRGKTESVTKLVLPKTPILPRIHESRHKIIFYMRHEVTEQISRHFSKATI